MNTEEGFYCNAGALDKEKQPHASLSSSAEEKQNQILWNCPASLPAQTNTSFQGARCHMLQIIFK